MRKLTTQPGLKSPKTSVETQENPLMTPKFDFDAADDEGERQADSPLHKAMVQRVLKRIQASERS